MIRIENLSFNYGRKKLFKDLEVQLKPGNIYGLLGKNGAGKTTLLKLISGLRYPGAGECRVFDYDPKKRLPGLLREIYFIPEEYFVPPVSMLKYVNIYAPFYPRFDRKVLTGCLEEFGLDADIKLTELSYGEKKKFLLAFGIATDCRLLILDEPTNGLDIPAKSQFRRILASVQADTRIIIVSTHQVRDMENLIDPIIILDEGQIIFNQYISDVSKHLIINLEQELPETGDVIYSADVLGGHVVVKENRSGEESRIELETLFNAVISNSDKINRLFAKEGKYENPAY
jgi:ABC-2 type transport system ATP-binding protein